MSDQDVQRPPVPTGGPSMHDVVIEELTAGDHVVGTTGLTTTRRQALCRTLEQRKQLGLERYGTILQAHNGRDQLQDSVDELADGIVYTRALITEYEDGVHTPLSSVELTLIRAAYALTLEAARILTNVQAMRVAHAVVLVESA